MPFGDVYIHPITMQKYLLEKLPSLACQECRNLYAKDPGSRFDLCHGCNMICDNRQGTKLSHTKTGPGFHVPPLTMGNQRIERSHGTAL